jgi:hypothetical protein
MVLMGDGGPEERHDAVTEKLVDRALVAVHLGQHEVEGSAHQAVDFLRVDPLGQRSEPRDIYEEDRDLLALAFERGLRREDAFGEVPGGVGLGAGEARLSGLLERCCTLAAELVLRRVTCSARRADGGERRRTLAAELHPGRILGLAPRTGHAALRCCTLPAEAISDRAMPRSVGHHSHSRGSDRSF